MSSGIMSDLELARVLQAFTPAHNRAESRRALLCTIQRARYDSVTQTTRISHIDCSFRPS